jgi:hypothetical protein
MRGNAGGSRNIAIALKTLNERYGLVSPIIPFS